MTVNHEEEPQKPSIIEEHPNLIILPRSEITEEEKNFVPDFNNEAIAAKQKRKGIILIVLLILAVAVGGLIFYGQHFNFYSRTMEHLHFNYLNGEVIDEETEAPFAKHGTALAELAQNGSLSFTAAAYSFDAQRQCLPAVSLFTYSGSVGTEQLNQKIGVSGSFLTKSRSFHPNAETTDDPEIYAIRDFLFGAKDHDGITIQCVNSYYTKVSEKPYLCELWLMSMPFEGRTIYYTLYRYYSESQLAGVRMLSSETEQMTVYDVTAYSFQ